ncbi:MAG: hypothetical protein GX964_09820 [Syntrophomonadaceae bacterium]|jgi:hypothetical protein|nr:hypothetical protein [Syntrophomonadaceae bacterium]
MKNTIRWGAHLLLIHLYFILIVWLAGYFPGLALLAMGVYLVIIWQAGRFIAHATKSSSLMTLGAIGLFAQLPGLVLAGACLAFYLYNISVPGDAAFALQLWHTPFMPLLTFVSFPVYQGYNLYFLALFILPVFYVLLLWAAGRTSSGQEQSPVPR